VKNNIISKNLSYLILLISFIIFSCSQSKEIKVVEEIYPNGNEKVVRYYTENNNIKYLISEFSFYEDGNKMYEGKYKNNLKHGVWTYWYEDSKVWSEGKYENGIETGKKRVFHPNGALFYTGAYKNGEPHGKWIFYNKHGIIVKDTIY